MRRLFLASWLFLPAASARAAAPALPRLSFEDVRLANGLRVILVPRRDAPVFAIAVTYNVGSRNERPGLTGFAHLFEHMMFQGSKNVGKGEHFILVLNNGGGMNGTTSEDRTNYFETLPKNQLDLALFLESDRMASLAVNQANLDNQRNAVQEEKRLRIDNQPYGYSEEEIENLAYDNFAYKHSGMGSMEDLNRAGLKDFLDFFQTYYSPNNAVLALVGDIEPAQALEKIRRYFGAIPPHAVPPPPDLTEPERRGERRETVDDPLARLPRLIASYHIPPGDTAENYALQALAIALGQGHSSRLYQRLVKERQLATDISAEADSRIGPSSFYIDALPRPGISMAELEQALYREIASVQKDGLTARELEKAKRQHLRNAISERETCLRTAVAIGQYAVKFGDPGLINASLDKLDAVALEDVRKAAAKYLVPEARAVVATFPKGPASAAPEARP